MGGYINFVDEEGKDRSKMPDDERIRRTVELKDNDDQSSLLDPTWPARLTAMHYYYAQKYYHQKHGHYASNITTELQSLVHPDIVAPFDIDLTVTKTSSKQNNNNKKSF